MMPRVPVLALTTIAAILLEPSAAPAGGLAQPGVASPGGATKGASEAEVASPGGEANGSSAGGEVREPEDGASASGEVSEADAGGEASRAEGVSGASAGGEVASVKGGAGVVRAAGEESAAKVRPRWWGPEPRPKVSGYGGPALRLSGLHGSFAALVGIEGGINVMQRVTIGASLLWLLGPVEAGSYARGAASRVDLNYGGVVADVAYVRGKRVAGTLGGLLGGGGACLQNPNNGDCADRTSFFVGEPRAGLRVVLAPIVRLHVAMGYRFVVGRAWSGPPEPRLGGPSGSVVLEFGWF